VLEDLGQRRWLVRATQVLAEIAKEDGDLAEAIERHRSVHASFAEQGDAVNATPSALALADALLDAGRIDEADALAAEAEREAPEDDLEAQVAWRSIRAVAAARRGNAAFAEELAREAAARAAASDFVLMRAETSETLAEVLSLAGRDGEARAAAAEAAEGYRRKGASAALERILAVGG